MKFYISVKSCISVLDIQSFILYYHMAKLSHLLHRRKRQRVINGKQRKLAWFKSIRTNWNACAVNTTRSWKSNVYRSRETWERRWTTSFRKWEMAGNKNNRMRGNSSVSACLSTSCPGRFSSLAPPPKPGKSALGTRLHLFGHVSFFSPFFNAIHRHHVCCEFRGGDF